MEPSKQGGGIIGALELTLVECSGLKAKKDFYCKIYYDGIPNNNKSWRSVNRKGSDPKFGQALHCWMPSFPVQYRVEIIEKHTFTKDKVVGTVAVTLETDEDQKLDDWHDLIDPKTNTGSGGKIHLQSSLRFTKNMPTDAFNFPANMHICIDSYTEYFTTWVEVQGDFDDMVMLKICGDATGTAPEKRVDNNGVMCCWRVSTGNFKASAFNVQSWKLKSDMVQNVALKLMDRFSAYGFRLCRGGQPYMEERGSGKDRRQVRTAISHLFMAKVAPPVEDLSRPPIHVLVNPTFWNLVFRMDVQGNLDRAFFEGIAQFFSVTETINDEDGSVVCRTLKFADPDLEKLFTLSFKTMKRKENAAQNFMVAVMNQLRIRGFSLATIWGDNMVFIYEPFKPQHEMLKSSFVLVDPTFWNGWSLEVQGAIDQEEMVQVAAKLETELSVTLDSKGYVGAWSLKVNNMGSMITFGFNIAELRRKENQFQNTMLKFLDAMASMGYCVATPHDISNFMLQKDPVTSQQRGTFLLVAPTYNNGYAIEVQGLINEQLLVEQIQPLGYSQMRKLEDKGVLSSYLFDVPDMGSMITFSLQIAETRRKENRLQIFILRTLDALATWGWNVLSPFGHQGPLLLQKFNTPQPGTYMLMDVNWYGTSVAVEVQGNVNESLLADIASKTGLTLEKHVDKDGLVLAFVLKPSAGEAIKFQITLNPAVARDIGNKFRSYMLRIMNHLTRLGFIYLFPWGKTVMFFLPANRDQPIHLTPSSEPWGATFTAPPGYEESQAKLQQYEGKQEI